jgi:hypothetical protein
MISNHTIECGLHGKENCPDKNCAGVKTGSLPLCFIPRIDNWQHCSEEGKKFDLGKLEYSLIPYEALEEIIKVLMFGKGKYGKDNWKLVEPKDRYIDAAFRHLAAYQKGDLHDEETGLSHLAHIGCCILFKLWEDVKDGKANKTDG